MRYAFIIMKKKSMKKINQIYDYAGLFFLSAIWGSSFLFIKLSVETIPPYFLTFFRLLIASIILSIFFKLYTNHLIFQKKNLWKMFFIALVGNFIPFNLISWSELYVESVVASTLIGTMPLFTCIIAHFSKTGEKTNLFVFFGLFLGLFGIISLFDFPSKNFLSNNNFMNLIILFSAFCYALSANCVKSVGDLSSLQVATSSTIYATILSCISLPIILCNHDNSLSELITSISLKSLFASLMLGILCTATAIIIFFYLIKKKGAVFASQSNFLIPCFGILWSYLFLDEDISKQIMLGLIVILFGLYFVHKGRN